MYSYEQEMKWLFSIYYFLLDHDFFLIYFFFAEVCYTKTVRVYHEIICYGCCSCDMRFLYLVFNKQKRKWKDKKREDTTSGVWSR